MNLQSILDELNQAKVIIEGTLRDHSWESAGDQSLLAGTWPEVRNLLKGEPGFHPAYAAARDAWDLLTRAENARMGSLVDENPDTTLEDEELMTDALARIESAEQLLWNYLGNVN